MAARHVLLLLLLAIMFKLLCSSTGAGGPAERPHRAMVPAVSLLAWMQPPADMPGPAVHTPGPSVVPPGESVQTPAGPMRNPFRRAVRDPSHHLEQEPESSLVPRPPTRLGKWPYRGRRAARGMVVRTIIGRLARLVVAWSGPPRNRDRPGRQGRLGDSRPASRTAGCILHRWQPWLPCRRGSAGRNDRSGFASLRRSFPAPI